MKLAEALLLPDRRRDGRVAEADAQAEIALEEALVVDRVQQAGPAALEEDGVRRGPIVIRARRRGADQQGEGKADPDRSRNAHVPLPSLWSDWERTKTAMSAIKRSIEESAASGFCAQNNANAPRVSSASVSAQTSA